MRLSEAQGRRTASAMLESLSTWFRMRAYGNREAHSFNDLDVSELLAELAEEIKPRPRPAGRRALEDQG